MTICLERNELLPILGGEGKGSDERLLFEGVATTSDMVRGGELFFPLKDGISSAVQCKEAFSKGASLCVCDQDLAQIDGIEQQRVIIVESLKESLISLTKWWKERLNLPVVVVCGAVGKTSTAHLIASFALKKGRGYYSYAHPSTLVGALTGVLNFLAEHKWGIVEVCESDALEAVRLLAPNVVVFCEPYKGTTKAVEEITSLIPKDGVLLRSLPGKERGEVWQYDKGGGETLAASYGKIEVDLFSGISFAFRVAGKEEDRVRVKMLGEHHAAAIAVAWVAAGLLGVVSEEVKVVFANYLPPAQRLFPRHTASGRLIVDDTSSERAESLAPLFSLAGRLSSLEVSWGLVLALESKKALDKALEQSVRLGAEFVVGVGENADRVRAMGSKYSIKTFGASSPIAAAHLVHKMATSVIFVKGCPEMGLDRTVETLLEVEGEVPFRPEEGNQL